ncbi:MAG: hypothetical protein AAGG51_06940 [Cyanobacteria bacterium P01_G01_bin.54]
MNSNFSRFSTQSSLTNLGCLLSLVAIAVGLSAVGLGWVVNGVFILIALIALSPVLAVIIFGIWARRNIISGNCPVCEAEITTLNESTLTCATCGEPLEVRSRRIQRVTPPGTIDVDAVSVDVVDTTATETGSSFSSTMRTIEAEVVDES